MQNRLPVSPATARTEPAKKKDATRGENSVGANEL
jgi:hypothetical protein